LVGDKLVTNPIYFWMFKQGYSNVPVWTRWTLRRWWWWWQ